MMDEKQARTLMDALARTSQPPTQVNIAALVTRGHRRHTRHWMATAAVVVTVVAIGGIGLTTLHSESAPTQHRTDTGTLQGHLKMIGGPGIGKPVTLPGTITITGNGMTRRVHTNHDGSYTVPLPPGTYTLTGHSPSYGDGSGACSSLTPARIRTRQTTVTDTICNVN
jgi:hypothetical protein